jgi:hypothetical protein
VTAKPGPLWRWQPTAAEIGGPGCSAWGFPVLGLRGEPAVEKDRDAVIVPEPADHLAVRFFLRGERLARPRQVSPVRTADAT